MKPRPPFMTRRDMLRYTGSAAALALLGRRAYGFDRPRRRPNVVMIVGDDHRHSALGALGEPTVSSPVLDAFIARSTTLTCAHDMHGKNGAVCVPTRACLMTGCNTFRALERPRGNTIAPGRVTLIEQFRSAGYETFMTGKWHNDKAAFSRSFDDARAVLFGGMTNDQYRCPVQDFNPTGVYDRSRIYHATKFSTDFFTDHAVDYLRRRRSDQPFFLYTAFTSPHDPRTPPAEFAYRYQQSRIPVPSNFLPEFPFDNGALHIRDERLAPLPRTPGRMQHEIAAYYGMISNIDYNVSRVLAVLDEIGEADNTIVIYTADHGLAVGQHGLLGKQNLFECSVRVPLVIHGPGVPVGLRSNALAYSWDLFPTLCELTGVPVPAGLDAQSLMPILRRQRTEHRSEVFAYYMDFQRMVKRDNWKLIEYLVHGVRHTELYDLAADPWEIRNLATDPRHAAKIRYLRGRLAAWQKANGDTTFPLPS